MERAVDELGRIVLPIETRQRYKIKVKDRLIIHETPNGILLTKAVKACLFCEAKMKLVKINDFYVCADCIQKLGMTKIGGVVDLSDPSDEGAEEVATEANPITEE